MPPSGAVQQRRRDLKRRVLTEAARLDRFTSAELRDHLRARGIDLHAHKVGGMIASWQIDGLIVGDGASPRRWYRWVEAGEVVRDPLAGIHWHRDEHGKLISHQHGADWTSGHAHLDQRPLLGRAAAFGGQLPDGPERQRDDDRRNGDHDQSAVGHKQVAAPVPPAGRPQPVPGDGDHAGNGDGDYGRDRQRGAKRQQQHGDGRQERAERRRPAHGDGLDGAVHRPAVGGFLEQDPAAHREGGRNGDGKRGAKDDRVRRVLQAHDDADGRHQPVETAEHRLADHGGVLAHRGATVEADDDDDADGPLLGPPIRIGRLSHHVGKRCLHCGDRLSAGLVVRVEYDRANEPLGAVHERCSKVMVRSSAVTTTTR